MIEYVVVNARQKLSDKVLLVLKNRPIYMAGRLNLVGGKLESGETPEEAAIRELKEESGLDGFNPVVCGKIIWKECLIYCLNCEVRDTLINPRPCETEEVDWYQIKEIFNDSRLMPNLKIIIPLLTLDCQGWVISDKKTSLDLPVHEVVVTLSNIKK